MPEQVMDNARSAPVVPSGTEPTLYGKTAFEGQAPVAPTNVGAVVETPQTNPQEVGGNAVPTSTFEELAAKKGFKSADDLAKSYIELEKAKTEQSMDMSELLRARDVEQASAPTQDLSQDEAIKIVESLIDKKVRPLQETLEIQKTFKNQEDMQYAPEVAKLVKENPTVPWSIALDTVKFRKGQEGLREQVKQETYQEIQQKQQFTQSDEASLGHQKQVDIAKLVNDKSIPFSEVQRIMKEKYAQ